jgi:enediyne biosynthesis protein E4
MRSVTSHLQSALLPMALAMSSTPGWAAPPVAPSASAVRFVDVTAAAGIRFKHQNGATGRKYLPETMGSGCAFIDYDNDGDLDIFFVNSKRWPGQVGPKSLPALYRNNGNGTFTDVTVASGLGVEIYGLGVAVADYDSDGWDDLYVTALGPNKLFRNVGNGRFVDVTTKASVGDPGFSTSAAFVDYDRDGHPDLFVCNYVEWSTEKDLFCSLDSRTKSYCTPESYKGQSPRLFRNAGNGTFADVTQKAGLLDPTSKALGVSVLDFDLDGWPDLFVANDTQPNKLYRNDQKGGFTDVAVQAGVAFSETGVVRAGMGTDAADYDGSGRESLLIGNFSNEMMALYHNEGKGLFIDEAPTTAVGLATLLKLTFGCFFFDYDLDGRVDIFGANGHVADDIGVLHPRIGYAQTPHLFRNLGGKKFEDVSSKMGQGFLTPAVGRGAAYGDFDGDGDLDLLLTANGGAARLLRNDGGNANAFLRVRLVGGSASGRGALGARATVVTTDGRKQSLTVRSGSSYCSASDRTLTFGLGPGASAQSLEIAWPDGKKETIPSPALRRTLVVEQGRGVQPGPSVLPRTAGLAKPAGTVLRGQR